MLISFKEFLNKSIEEKLTASCYMGIIKKDFPKWEGWKIIEIYKEKGVAIDKINDKHLNILVENFYRLEYIKQLTS